MSPTILDDARARWLASGAAIGLVAALVVSPALLPGRTARAVDPATGGATPDHTISVGGTGRVRIAPDVADLRIGLTLQRPTATAARDDAAAALEKVIAALRAAGVAERDIQTSVLSLQPVYDYSPDGSPPRLTGYQMSHILAVVVRKIDDAAGVADDAIAAGATQLDSISFRVDDPIRAEDEARTLAMADAKRRAEALASAAGVTIVGVASIVESSPTTVPPVWYGGAAATGLDKAATPIMSGTNEVVVTVSVAYLVD